MRDSLCSELRSSYQIAMRTFFVLVGAVLLASCAHREPEVPVVDPTSLGDRLSTVARTHNSARHEQFADQFSKNATIQLPASPRGATVSTYLNALALDPYTISFTKPEMVYSLPTRAATRSTMTANSPGRFNIQERVTVDWIWEDGSWKIARIAVSEWPAIVGTWRRSGLKGEGSIELRILPGNTYAIYLGEDMAVPAFRGRYTLEGNRITFTDTSANEATRFESAPGSYTYIATGRGMTLTRIDEGNSWRKDRFEGDWNGSR